MFKEYHPMAEYLSDKGTTETLFVTDSCLNLETAKRAHKVWKDGYKLNLTKAWIDVFVGGNLVETITVDPKTI